MDRQPSLAVSTAAEPIAACETPPSPAALAADTPATNAATANAAADAPAASPAAVQHDVPRSPPGSQQTDETAGFQPVQRRRGRQAVPDPESAAASAPADQQTHQAADVHQRRGRQASARQQREQAAGFQTGQRLRGRPGTRAEQPQPPAASRARSEGQSIPLWPSQQHVEGSARQPAALQQPHSRAARGSASPAPAAAVPPEQPPGRQPEHSSLVTRAAEPAESCAQQSSEQPPAEPGTAAHEPSPHSRLAERPQPASTSFRRAAGLAVACTASEPPAADAEICKLPASLSSQQPAASVSTRRRVLPHRALAIQV